MIDALAPKATVRRRRLSGQRLAGGTVEELYQLVMAACRCRCGNHLQCCQGLSINPGPVSPRPAGLFRGRAAASRY